MAILLSFRYVCALINAIGSLSKHFDFMLAHLTRGNRHLHQRLISLIKTSKDDDVIAIACYDLGEFVRFYPNGRLVVKGMGAREVVLRATEHENPDVQRQALLCISKILVQNWAVRLVLGR